MNNSWISKAAPFFIGFAFLAIVGWWVFVATFLVKGADYVEKNGLKSVVNQVWDRANPSQNPSTH